MTLAPINFPTTSRITLYLNGTHPTPIVLTSPVARCHKVNFQRCAPATGRASFTIYTGEMLADVDPQTNIAGTGRYNFKFGTVAEIEKFVSQVRGCFVKIETLENVRSRDVSTDGSAFSVRETLDTASDDTGFAPDAWQVIFVGKVYSTSRICENWSHPLSIECIDIGEWMNTDGFYGLPQRVGFGFGLIHQSCLPDFNEIKNGVVCPNKDTAGNKTIHITNVVDGKDISLTCNPFNGEDPNTAQGFLDTDFWNGQDIVLNAFDYWNSYNADVLQKIGLDITVNDKTNGLYKIVETYSARKSIWQTICDVIAKDKSLSGYWTYSGDAGSTSAVFNIVFLSDADLAGFTATDTYDYNLDNDPVWAYTHAPVLSYDDTSKAIGVRVETDPVAFYYTFALKDNFTPAFPDGDGPGADAIKDGGVNAIWWNRYALNVHTLNKISSYALTSDSMASEGWAPSTTAIGVKFDSSSTDPSLTFLNTSDPNEFLPFPGTCKITTTIPFSNTDGAGVANSINTPAYIFYKNGTDDIEAVEFNTRFVNNIMQTRQKDGDEELFKDSTDGYFMTIGVEGTPPLYRYFTTDQEFTNNDDSVITLKLRYKPAFILNNTVLANDPDGSGKPVLIANGDGIGTLRCANAGDTLQSIYDDMEIAARWYLRKKVKATWTISFIDPTPLCGKFLKTLDIPGPVNDSDSDIIVGIGDERFIRTEINAIITGITFDFDNKTTSYETDFAFYKGTR